MSYTRGAFAKRRNKGKQVKAARYSAIFFVSAALVLTSCNDLGDYANSILYEGTTIGVTACLRLNKDQSIDEQTLRIGCANKHQKPRHAEFSGQATYRQSDGKVTAFSGHVVNDSDDVIVTSFRIKVIHEDNKDKAGKQQKEFFTVSDIWLEPKEEHYFKFDDLSFVPKVNRVKEGDKYFHDWVVFETKGVKIKLK